MTDLAKAQVAAAQLHRASVSAAKARDLLLAAGETDLAVQMMEVFDRIQITASDLRIRTTNQRAARRTKGWAS